MLVIAYSSAQGYLNMVNRLNRMCNEWGIQFRAYTREMIEKSEFYLPNKEVLDVPKGNGLWLWKPYIIMDALTYDDEVIYLDSSVVPSGKEALLRIMKDTDKVSAPRVSDELPHKLWTKRDCFKIMNCDYERWWNAPHVWAGVVPSRFEGMNILADWLYFCRNFDAISDDPGENNFIGFHQHMNDQSILANILQTHEQPLLDGRTDFKDDVDYYAR